MARQLVDSNDFTGAAGTTPAGWSLWRGLQITCDGNGNAQVQVQASTAGSFRNAGTYNTNQYCEVTMTNASNGAAGQNVDVGIRAQSEANGYLAIFTTGWWSAVRRAVRWL